VHHLVVYNLGEGRNGYDRNDAPVFAGGPSVGGAATGAILKGDYNRMWQCTIFNTSVHGQGDLCPTTKQLGPAPGRSFPLLGQQNEHSVYLNTAAKLITGQVREKRYLTFLSFLVQVTTCQDRLGTNAIALRALMMKGTVHTQGGPLFPNASFAAWKAIARLDEAAMMLRDPTRFDFRPQAGSPLVGSGVVHSPQVPRREDGKAPDIGAYQADDADPWRPGCTFHPAC
jgi:hypothetical protein